MQTINADDKEIKIVTLGEAVALYSLGFELIRLEPTSKPRQRWFIFNRFPPEKLGEGFPTAEVVKDYQHKALSVEAKTFFESIKELKTKLAGSWEQGE